VIRIIRNRPNGDERSLVHKTDLRNRSRFHVHRNARKFLDHVTMSLAANAGDELIAGQDAAADDLVIAGFQFGG